MADGLSMGKRARRLYYYYARGGRASENGREPADVEKRLHVDETQRLPCVRVLHENQQHCNTTFIIYIYKSRLIFNPGTMHCTYIRDRIAHSTNHRAKRF